MCKRPLSIGQPTTQPPLPRPVLHPLEKPAVQLSHFSKLLATPDSAQPKKGNPVLRRDWNPRLSGPSNQRREGNTSVQITSQRHTRVTGVKQQSSLEPFEIKRS